MSTPIPLLSATRGARKRVSAFCLVLGLTATTWANDGAGLFVDATLEAGIDFVHVNGMNGQFYYPEINGAGVAFLDYDNDGDLDVYLIQGGSLGAQFPNHNQALDASSLTDQLYRNDLEPDGHLKFVKVTQASGIRATGFGFGAAAADIDNDGWTDLYLTNFGPNQMWRNLGGGRFTDISEHSGTNDPRWSMSAAFFDYDRDGLPDLFVTNYLRYDHASHKRCVTSAGYPDYCGPDSYDDARDRLYRNLGGGRFEDVTQKAGLHRAWGAGMGVTTLDANDDFWPDLYVANDADPNQLWINQKDGTFRNEALLAGCAVNGFGKNEAGMGVAAGDYDGDGYEDLLVTHLTRETHTLYRRTGPLFYEDVTLTAGLGASTLEATGWSVAWFDFDNDGWLDFFVANGTVEAIGALIQKKDPFPYHQPNQLFRNLEGRRFEDVSHRAGAAFQISEVSRGAAFGDVDNDGDGDVVVTQNNGPARLLLNRTNSNQNWIGIRAVAGEPIRDVLGAWVCLERSDGRRLCRRVRADGGYLASHDTRLIFGLGGARVKKVHIQWTEDAAETWTGLAPGRYHTLRKGEARP